RHLVLLQGWARADSPTLSLHDALPISTIAIAEGEDPESAASEYGAAWRVAGGTLVRPEAYDACVDHGILERAPEPGCRDPRTRRDRKSTRLNSSHVAISYAVFCLKKKK